MDGGAVVGHPSDRCSGRKLRIKGNGGDHYGELGRRPNLRQRRQEDQAQHGEVIPGWPQHAPADPATIRIAASVWGSAICST